jgi:hypothetical protein
MTGAYKVLVGKRDKIEPYTVSLCRCGGNIHVDSKVAVSLTNSIQQIPSWVPDTCSPAQEIYLVDQMGLLEPDIGFCLELLGSTQ